MDPKHIKTLADILALVLVDQPGESMAALEAVRRRAKHDGVTGGALKEMIQQLSQDHQKTSWVPPRAASTTQIDQLRTALMESQRRFVETRLELDRERRDATTLRRRLEEVNAPLLRSRRTLAEAAYLRARVGDLERRLQYAAQLETELISLRSAQLATPRWKLQTPLVNAFLFSRFAQAGACFMLAVCLVFGLNADQAPFPSLQKEATAHHQPQAHKAVTRKPSSPPVIISL